MIDNEGDENVVKIKEAGNYIWGEQFQIKELKDFNMPFCMFELYVNIYNKYDILLTYDRSIIGINIKIEGEYKNIRKLTNKEIKKGFDSNKYENIIYNFKILEDII